MCLGLPSDGRLHTGSPVLTGSHPCISVTGASFPLVKSGCRPLAGDRVSALLDLVKPSASSLVSWVGSGID